MSLLFKPNSARLSVIGNGWNNVSFDSGGGFVFDDLLWKDIALDLDYDFDMDMDFGELDLPEFDLSDIIFDLDGTIYTEMDGAWRNPLTGELYPGGGDMWISEKGLLKAAGKLSNNAYYYEWWMQYSIPQKTLDQMRANAKQFSGVGAYDSNGRWRYWGWNKKVWWVIYNFIDHKPAAECFLEEEFEESNGASWVGMIRMPQMGWGGYYPPGFPRKQFCSADVYSMDKVESPEDGFMIAPSQAFDADEYRVHDGVFAEQFLQGSFEPYIKKAYGDFSAKDTTITTGQIKNGTSGLESREYDGKTYYKV